MSRLKKDQTRSYSERRDPWAGVSRAIATPITFNRAVPRGGGKIWRWTGHRVGLFFSSGQVGAGYPGHPDRPVCYLKWDILMELRNAQNSRVILKG